MPTTETFLDVPGARLKVVVDGAGPPVVLVHSAIVDLRSWDALVPLLAEAGYRVIRYDTRGYGESTAEDVEFSNRDDLVAVLDAVGAGRAAVVGNSRGAIIALDTVVQYPDRFVACAWVGGGISGFGMDTQPTPEELALFEAYDVAEGAGDMAAMADLDVRIWADGVGQPATRVPEVREAVRMMDTPLVTPGRVFGRPIPLDPPADGRLGGVRIPVLAVVGELDTKGTRESAERLASAVPSGRLVRLPGVAHMVGMEVPETLAGLIVELLAPLPRWT
jgi:3-oxoadipate enol-lactonase